MMVRLEGEKVYEKHGVVYLLDDSTIATIRLVGMSLALVMHMMLSTSLFAVFPKWLATNNF